MKRYYLIFLTVFLMAFGEKHSDVKVSSKIEKKVVYLEFMVKAHNSYLITKEAPWKIELHNPKGVFFQNNKQSYESKNMIDDIPGFKAKLLLDEKMSNASVDYKIKAFVCTADKKRCFPQSLNGTYIIK